MDKNKILTEIYNDEFYKGYIDYLAPESKADDFYSYFLLKMCEMCSTKIEMLREGGVLKSYASVLINNELFNKKSPFNKLHGI